MNRIEAYNIVRELGPEQNKLRIAQKDLSTMHGHGSLQAKEVRWQMAKNRSQLRQANMILRPRE